jgi:hypothetical protein
VKKDAPPLSFALRLPGGGVKPTRDLKTYAAQVEGARLQAADAKRLDVERRTSEETAQPTDLED